MNPQPAKTPRASAVKKMPNKHKAVLLMRAHSRFPMKDTTLGSTYWEQPVWVLPATPEAYEAQVEAIALLRMPAFPSPKLTQERLERLAEMMRRMVRDDLASIGIRQPRPARSRK